METTKRITLATIKAFIRKNRGNLYIKVGSKFDSMTDGVRQVGDAKTKVSFVDGHENNLGISGAWFVLRGRDYFTKLENGYAVSNSCGSFELTRS